MTYVERIKSKDSKMADTRSPQLRSALINIRRCVRGPIEISINEFGGSKKSFKLEIIPSDVLTKLRITNKISSDTFQFKTEIFTLDHFTGQLEYTAENYGLEANAEIKSSPGDKKYPDHLDQILLSMLGKDRPETPKFRPVHWQEMTKDLFGHKKYFTPSDKKTITQLLKSITTLIKLNSKNLS